MNYNTYELLLNEVLKYGTLRTNRTKTKAISLFGKQMRFNIKNHFPLITTKKMNIKSIILELLWFLKGKSNINWLKKHGVNIWNQWADEKGNLGPIYGEQWRAWPTHDYKNIDQIANLMESLKKDPYSRRHIISSWNVGLIKKMALAPCHIMCQFYVDANNIDNANKKYLSSNKKMNLSCQVYQRSADLFLGVPFNIASYALLTNMIAQQLNMIPKELIWISGDCHIYENHITQVRKQLERSPYEYPKLKIIKKPLNIFCYHYNDFKIINYKHYPKIKGLISE